MRRYEDWFGRKAHGVQDVRRHGGWTSQSWNRIEDMSVNRVERTHIDLDGIII